MSTDAGFSPTRAGDNVAQLILRARRCFTRTARKTARRRRASSGRCRRTRSWRRAGSPTSATPSPAKPEARNGFLQTAKAIYAARTVEAGTGPGCSTRLALGRGDQARNRWNRALEREIDRHAVGDTRAATSRTNSSAARWTTSRPRGRLPKGVDVREALGHAARVDRRRALRLPRRRRNHGRQGRPADRGRLQQSRTPFRSSGYGKQPRYGGYRRAVADAKTMPQLTTEAEADPRRTTSRSGRRAGFETILK
jgi:hypothetical protein